MLGFELLLRLTHCLRRSILAKLPLLAHDEFLFDIHALLTGAAFVANFHALIADDRVRIAAHLLPSSLCNLQFLCRIATAWGYCPGPCFRVRRA